MHAHADVEGKRGETGRRCSPELSETAGAASGGCCDAALEFQEHTSYSFDYLSTSLLRARASLKAQAAMKRRCYLCQRVCVHLLPRLLWVRTSEETLRCSSQISLGCMLKITPSLFSTGPFNKTGKTVAATSGKTWPTIGRHDSFVGHLGFYAVSILKRFLGTAVSSIWRSSSRLLSSIQEDSCLA